MRKIREVMRLKAAGLTSRQIATSTRSARTTICEYLARAEQAGVTWPLPDDLDDEALERKLFPPPTAEQAQTRPVPDWRDVHRQLKSKKHHMTLRLLWLEWKRDNPTGWQYTTYTVMYKRWLDTKDVVMRLDYKAGEAMLVDFSGDKAEIVDPGTGEVTEVEIFVAILGCSGLLYVEATRSQGLESWIPAHENAWAFYGGVTEVTIPDNLKAGVTEACFYDPVVNRTYADLATHYETVVLPTRAAKPKDKAAVEAGVLTAERWVLAPLRHHRFFSLAELNAAIAKQLKIVNNRAFRGETTSRRELFEELEREALRPLPSSTFELASWKTVTVHVDYHVEGPDHKYYSVPFKLVGQKLDMRITGQTIEVFRANVRVASHPREHGRRRYITDPAHMPESHRAHAEWTPERFITWAATIGPEVAELAGKIIESRPHPEHAYRSCLGVMSLGRKYGNDRLRAASERALHSGATSYSSVKSILQENLDRVPLKDQGPVPPPPDHENIRGAEYYAGEEES